MSNGTPAPTRAAARSDARTLVFSAERLRAQAGQCIHFGHIAAPRCTQQAVPGTQHCTDHTREN